MSVFKLIVQDGRNAEMVDRYLRAVPPARCPEEAARLAEAAEVPRRLAEVPRRQPDAPGRPGRARPAAEDSQ